MPLLAHQGLTTERGHPPHPIPLPPKGGEGEKKPGVRRSSLCLCGSSGVWWKRRVVELGDCRNQRSDQMLGTAEAEIHRLRQRLQRRRCHRTCYTELHRHLVVVTHVLECIGEPELHPAEI